MGNTPSAQEKEKEEERRRLQAEREERLEKLKLEQKRLEFEHEQIMDKQAKDASQFEKTLQCKHESLSANVDKVLSIAENVYKVTPVNTMQEATYGLAVLHSLMNEQNDKDVLNAVSSKIPALKTTQIQNEVTAQMQDDDLTLDAAASSKSRIVAVMSNNDGGE